MKESLSLFLNSDENDTHNEDYRGIILEVLDLFENNIQLPPPLGYKPLSVAYGPHPKCFVDHLPNYYLIHVNRSDVVRDWCKFVYEFSHELCHIYSDPRVNNWFIESLCDLASIYYLDKIGIKWKENGNDFGNAFLSYKDDYINRQLTSERLNGYNENLKWLKNEIKNLKTSTDRELNTAIAVKLFPYFKDNPNYWKILPFLSKSTGIDLSSETEFHDNTIIDVIELEAQLTANSIYLDLSIIKELWNN